MATLFGSAGEVRASSGGNPLVLTFNGAGAADKSFYSSPSVPT
jgi:hypothetical protein